jgi:hypothetical protein
MNLLKLNTLGDISQIKKQCYQYPEAPPCAPSVSPASESSQLLVTSLVSPNYCSPVIHRHPFVGGLFHYIYIVYEICLFG